MEVLLAVTLSERGGAQRHVADLARGLLSRGHSVHLATSGAGPLVEDALAAGVTVHVQENLVRELAPRRDLAALKDMRRLVHELAPDVVHAHSSKAGAIARFAALAKRRPSLYTAHGFVFLEPLSLSRKTAYLAMEAIGGRAGTRLIAVSARDAAAARRYRLASPSRIVTIPNGYDPPPPPPLPAGPPFRFAALSNAYPTKGLGVLIDALSMLDRDLLPEVVVAGDGPERASLERRSRGLPVEWVGRVDDVAPILASVHALVLPSLKEGWPYAVLEAMGAGRAVVASDVGGVRDQLGGEEAGWVVPPGDPGSLARAIGAVVADPAEAERRGRLGARRVRELFTVDGMVDAVVAEYQQALAVRRAHG